MPEDEVLEQRALQGMQLVVDYLEATSSLLGYPLHSRWPGTVTLRNEHEMPFAKARVLDNGHVEFRRDYLIEPADYWPAFLNEAIHTCSIGATRFTLQDLPGYEEGVVEALHRVIRPKFLKSQGVQISSESLAERDAENAFMPYLAALERIRQALGEGASDAERFYTELLLIEHRKRPGHLLVKGRELPLEKQRQFLQVFSQAHAVLKQSSRQR